MSGPLVRRDGEKDGGEKVEAIEKVSDKRAKQEKNVRGGR